MLLIITKGLDSSAKVVITDYRSYLFYLRVFIDLRIKTREGVPEAPPVDVRANAVNSTCVRVTWRPPDPQKINGINLGYRLQAWVGKDEAKSIRVAPSLVDPWAEQSALMSGLEKFTEYNVTVLCFTDPGDGKRSTLVNVRTNEDGKLNYSLFI